MIKSIADTLYQMTYGHPLIQTPFGTKYLINADTTATGYPNRVIENIIMNQILPYYSNTHSNAYSGRLMAKYIEDSKKIIRKSINAKPCDQIIFTGNGCSGCINHLIHSLDLKNTLPDSTVIFITKAEHHSNHLPWTHLPIKLIYIPVLNNGLIDVSNLEKQLVKYSKSKKIIASFNATSNVTGVHQNVNLVSQMIHNYGGLIFWDYAASAPYVEINIHHDDTTGQYFDAIFISTHKFFGGVGTPGILVANQNLFQSKIPYSPAGGTVRFVCSSFQTYTPNIETKETGGTPNIIGCIKSGLVFDLKSRYQKYIKKKDNELLKYVEQRLLQIPDLKLLNPVQNSHRLPIFVFMMNSLHYNLVVVLLNDLFGIQTRGGISCCSLLAQDILHISPSEQKKIHNQIVSDKGVPGNYGWCRISFHYCMPQFLVDYIIDAVQFISKYGKHFMDFYEYYPTKNNWFFTQNGMAWKDVSNTHLNLDLNANTTKLVYLNETLLQKQFQEVLKLVKISYII